MLTWQLVLIQLVTFVLIILTLRWLLYSHISQALSKLHKLNKQNVAKEKALKEELARAKKRAEGEIARAKKEADFILAKAKAESEQEAGKTLEQARKEAKRIIEEGVRESQRKVKEMETKMQEKAAYLASDIVEYILTEGTHRKLQSQLVDELIEEIKKIPSEKLKVENNSMDIISAFDLDSSQEAKLKEILVSKLGKEVSIKSQIDTDVVAGIILKSGGFFIDGSVRNKLNKILPIIKEKAKEA